jgi:hypothetical protein
VNLLTNKAVLEELALRSNDPLLHGFIKKLTVKTKHTPPEDFEALGLSPSLATQFSNLEGHIHKEDILLLAPQADKKLIDLVLNTA